MDKKIPIEPNSWFDDRCLGKQVEKEATNNEFRHRFKIRFALFSFFLIFLGLFIYEFILLPKEYINGGPLNGKVSPEFPCFYVNGKHLRLNAFKDLKSVKNCLN